jgi:hypothetical protein
VTAVDELVASMKGQRQKWSVEQRCCVVDLYDLVASEDKEKQQDKEKQRNEISIAREVVNLIGTIPEYRELTVKLVRRWVMSKRQADLKIRRGRRVNTEFEFGV